MKSIDPLGLNGFAAGWAANGGPYSGNGATLSGGVSGTVGSTTLGVNTSTSGVQWGQTTQLSLGIGLELCIIPEPVNEPNGCGVNQDDDNYPDNYSMGLGQNLGVTVRKDGAMCLNVGPSVGLPFGAGWDL